MAAEFDAELLIVLQQLHQCIELGGALWTQRGFVEVVEHVVEHDRLAHLHFLQFDHLHHLLVGGCILQIEVLRMEEVA